MLELWAILVSITYQKRARQLMTSSTEPADKEWSLLVDRHFQDFEEAAEMARGWDVDFRQLQAGRSSTDVLQFGSPDFLVTRFSMDLAYEQRGSTPPNMLTFAILDENIRDTTTPEGAITPDGIWCFPASREFAAASGAEFRGCTLSLSESLLDEVAELHELSNGRSAMGSGKVVRCRRADIDGIRHRLGRIYREIRSGGIGPSHLRQVHELEVDLTRRILEALAGPTHFAHPKMTGRRQLVLRRALDYLEANPNSPVTVSELARVAGAGVRTLEYVLKDYFGVTPKAYLTTRRLVGVRRELHSSNPVSIRVGVVANNWGFGHLSQFAKDYRQFFGELPSQTLQKR
jgi:AraC family ethanolamine operon transcriptional activator